MKPVQPGLLVLTPKSRLDRLGKLDAIHEVAPAKLGFLTRCTKLLQGVFANGLKKLVPSIGVAGLEDDQRPLHEPREQVQDVLRRDLAVGAHLLGGVQQEAAREHRQAAEENLLRL